MKARVVGLPGWQVQVTMDDEAISALIAPNRPPHGSTPAQAELRRRFGTVLRDALVFATEGTDIDISLDDGSRRAIRRTIAEEDAAR